MNGAILLTLLVPAQIPADAFRPQPVHDPITIQQQEIRQRGRVAVRQPAPFVHAADVRAVSVRQTRLGSRLVRLESRPEPTVMDGEIVAPPPPPQAGMLILRTMALAEGNFDEWVFTIKQDDRDRLAHLRMRLRRRLSEVEQARPLDPELRRKLELAGAGDIRRFLDRVEQGRARFEWARLDYESGMLALDAAIPLAEEFQDGPFGAGSLFAKSLARAEAGEIEAGRPVPAGRDATARP